MLGLKALANLDGLVITVPYKARIIPFVDRLRPVGEKVGAINVMRRDADGGWTGDMFDGQGLVRAVRAEGHAIEGRCVLLIGAGGVGSAIAVALAEAGVGAITVHDLEPSRAETLARRVARVFPGFRIGTGAPIVASSLPACWPKGPAGTGQLNHIDKVRRPML